MDLEGGWRHAGGTGRTVEVKRAPKEERKNTYSCFLSEGRERETKTEYLPTMEVSCNERGRNRAKYALE